MGPLEFFENKNFDARLNFGIGLLKSYLTFGYLTCSVRSKRISTLNPTVMWTWILLDQGSDLENCPALEQDPTKYFVMPSKIMNQSWGGQASEFSFRYESDLRGASKWFFRVEGGKRVFSFGMTSYILPLPLFPSLPLPPHPPPPRSSPSQLFAVTSVFVSTHLWPPNLFLHGIIIFIISKV